MVNPQKLSESVMAASQQKAPQMAKFRGPQPVIDPISAMESARYTADLLENLRKIAAQMGQPVLAHLLELAQAEARMLTRGLAG